jgi:Na+-exporting ATPase
MILPQTPQFHARGIFTFEVLPDMLVYVYGLWMATLCLTAFSLVLFTFGTGYNDYSSACDTVFRTRATTFMRLARTRPHLPPLTGA